MRPVSTHGLTTSGIDHLARLVDRQPMATWSLSASPDVTVTLRRSMLQTGMSQKDVAAILGCLSTGVSQPLNASASMRPGTHQLAGGEAGVFKDPGDDTASARTRTGSRGHRSNAGETVVRDEHGLSEGFRPHDLRHRSGRCSFALGLDVRSSRPGSGTPAP
jgi:hypothetical protein